ncbi:hypothetical protein CEXT_136271 [Caerostris extrusa]|uniref:Uncharacterized protein n=1 Tax=Caerostris extrusa TaxID=172846 RepID=A0AAV4VJC7_CAEEX|nr:hypothetical protein CEXT_136271 [Caerostris extrusa]
MQDGRQNDANLGVHFNFLKDFVMVLDSVQSLAAEEVGVHFNCSRDSVVALASVQILGAAEVAKQDKRSDTKWVPK